MWHGCVSQEAASGSGEEAGSGEDGEEESAEEEGSEDEGDEEDSESSPEPEARVLPKRATRGNRMQGVMEEEDEADQQFWGASISF